MDAVDWQKATEEQRARLYRVAKAVMDSAGLAPAEFYRAALNGQIVDPVSTGGNFSRGKIARRSAVMIHSWIESNHLDIALRVAPELFTRPARGGWLALLEERTRYGALSLLRFSSLGLVRQAGRHPIDERPVRLGEKFAFALTSEIAGHAFAFQEVRGLWHLFSLSEDPAAAFVSCGHGRHELPRKADGSPLALIEADTDGLHSFVFVVVEDIDTLDDTVSGLRGLALRPEQLGELATMLAALDAGQYAIHRINIQFVR
ncbi:hypothetical protein [Rhodovulum marinum]|uniref:Uncharacterized protein n=1 Tax=Rhodovulum marinum TaxID=320662 RepID=A0A4R2PSC6_9RHOB|nr:hypothetical protein [Rhodovulum marinum]TCP38770.1 hypothetical protein EV662_1174 [Rhodovulum marinum]